MPPADLRRITHRDDLEVTEYLISYNGAPWQFTVSIMEFRDDRIAHERVYIMDGWEAANWRAEWRAERSADPDPPPPQERPSVPS